MSCLYTSFVAFLAPEAPKFVQELRNCIVIVGETAKFTVRAAGRPKPEIRWYKEGISISPSNLICDRLQVYTYKKFNTCNPACAYLIG